MKSKTKPKKIPFFSKKNWIWYSFLIPTIVCLILMTYLPTLTGLKYSFYDVSVAGYSGDFVGFHNYKVLLMSKGFRKAFLNTIILILMSFSFIPLGYILAYAINSLGGSKWQGLFRTGFFLPYMVTYVSAVLVFKQVLTSNNGLLNQVLSFIAGKDVVIGWISDPAINKIGVTIIYGWQQIGYVMLICLAGLQSISGDILEAAEVDGANSFQRFFHICTPNMKDSFIFLFITSCISGFSRFTDLHVISGQSSSGGQGGALQSLMMYIYQYSFDNPDYGISSAGAIIVFLLVFVVTMINLKLTNFTLIDGE